MQKYKTFDKYRYICKKNEKKAYYLIFFSYFCSVFLTNQGSRKIIFTFLIIKN